MVEVCEISRIGESPGLGGFWILPRVPEPGETLKMATEAEESAVDATNTLETVVGHVGVVAMLGRTRLAQG